MGKPKLIRRTICEVYSNEGESDDTVDGIADEFDEPSEDTEEQDDDEKVADKR